jgi:hypothetical protein
MRQAVAIQKGQVGGCPAAGPPVPNPLFGTPRTDVQSSAAAAVAEAVVLEA